MTMLFNTIPMLIIPTSHLITALQRLPPPTPNSPLKCPSPTGSCGTGTANERLRPNST